MTIVAVVAAIQDLMLGVTGIRVAPDYAPDNLHIWPASVVFPDNGTIDSGPPGIMKGLHNIIIEIHIPKKDLQKDLEKAIPFIESVPMALLGDPTLGDTVSTFGLITYVFGPMTWGEGTTAMSTIGPRFTINDVKLQTAIST